MQEEGERSASCSWVKIEYEEYERLQKEAERIAAEEQELRIEDLKLKQEEDRRRFDQNEFVEITTSNGVVKFINNEAQILLRNMSTDQNVAIKIKVTAPKLFIVTPILAIINPSTTFTVKVKLQSEAGLSDALRHKIKVEATPTEVQSQESTELASFWEKKAKSPDFKTTVQSCVMKFS